MTTKTKVPFLGYARYGCGGENMDEKIKKDIEQKAFEYCVCQYGIEPPQESIKEFKAYTVGAIEFYNKAIEDALFVLDRVFKPDNMHAMEFFELLKNIEGQLQRLKIKKGV